MKKRQAIYRFAYLNKWLVAKIVVVVLGWIMAYKCYDAVKDIEEIKGFVPHEILGI